MLKSKVKQKNWEEEGYLRERRKNSISGNAFKILKPIHILKFSNVLISLRILVLFFQECYRLAGLKMF